MAWSGTPSPGLRVGSCYVASWRGEELGTATFRGLTGIDTLAPLVKYCLSMTRPVLRAWFSFAAAMACFFTWAGEEAAPPELRKLREAYFAQVRKVQDKYFQDITSLPGKHEQALLELEKTFQKAGDLKSLLAVREERGRFAQNPDPSAVRPVERPRPLALLQEDYIRSCRDLARLRAQAVLDLTRKYSQSLSVLQKELTQQGRIEDALRVMREIEQIKDSEPVRTAQGQLSGDPMPDPVSTSVARSGALDLAALSQFVHGEIVSWNSVTGEIICRYDFSRGEQAMDWEGGTLDEVRERLVSPERPVRFLLPFKAVSKIEYAGYLYEGEGGLRVSVGGVVADIGSGPNRTNLVLFQDNEHYALARFQRDIERFMRYESVLTIRETKVEWWLNGKLLSGVTLPRSLSGPVYISLGREGTRSMFDDVVITGVLHTPALLGVAK